VVSTIHRIKDSFYFGSSRYKRSTDNLYIPLAFLSCCSESGNLDFGDHNDNMSIPLHNIRSEILTKVSQPSSSPFSMPSASILNVQTSYACQVIEFCERHRPDRPPLMKPYAPPPPPPPKPYWQMTAQERETERLKALGFQPPGDPAHSATVKLEQDGPSANATASGSGSGNADGVGGTEQVGTDQATNFQLNEM
jgi:hypothetical protein